MPRSFLSSQWWRVRSFSMPSAFTCTRSKLQAGSSFSSSLCKCFGRLDAKPGAPEPGRDLAVFPLAVPSIAGPGAMMAVILLTDNDVYTVAEQAQTGVVLLVVLLLTYILLLFSDAILRIIGRQGAAILVRVMGIILASLAVEIVLTTLGVASWAPVPR